MLRSLAGEVENDTADRSTGDLSIAIASLIESHEIDAELDDDRRAMLAAAAETYDPERLYAQEVERDAATDYLADNLPAGVSIRLAQHRVTQRTAGTWERIDGWCASITSDDVSVSENGSNALVAAELVMNAYRRTCRRQRLTVVSVEVSPRPAA